MTGRRRFSKEQKLLILNQAQQIGIIAALREHKLSYSVYSRWKHKLKPGETGNGVSKMASKSKTEWKNLEEENTTLKKIIADMALELERKEEELKKINRLFLKR